MSERFFEFPEMIHATKAEYIDPANCGSMVAYKITSTNYFEAEVDLTDCNRKITWSFNGEDVGTDKIDRAIAVLTSFRTDYIKAIKAWKKLQEQREKFDAQKLHEQAKQVTK